MMRRAVILVLMLGIALAAFLTACGGDATAARSATARAAFLPRGVALRTMDGETQLILQPGGPFGAMVFRDGARGEHLGIVYPGAMPGQRDGAWALDDRFWQEPAWSADATALVWNPDGTALYVSTGGRGSGAVFRLDLRDRRSRQVWPTPEVSTADQGEGRSCEIMSADAARRLLRVRYQPAATRQPVAVDVRME